MSSDMFLISSESGVSLSSRIRSMRASAMDSSRRARVFSSMSSVSAFYRGSMGSGGWWLVVLSGWMRRDFLR